MRRWVRIVGLAVLATVVLLMLGAFVASRSLGAGMIVARSVPLRATHALPPGARAVEVAHGGADLRAWVIDPKGAPRATVFVLHGIRDSKRSQVDTARRLADLGFRAVAVDLRCHGESSGEWMSYGVRESQDVRALADELGRRGLLVEPLGVLGFSYGAATAIQVAARDPRVRAVVAIAPFASLREVVPAYVDWMLGPLAATVPASWLTDVVDEAGQKARFNPDDACPRCVAAQLDAPLLLIHSQDDERIPFAHSEAIRDGCAAPVQLMPVDGASHNETPGAPGVTQAADAWLLRHLGEPEAGP